MAGTKTYQAKPGEVVEKWWVVDATDKVVGRLASEIAMILMGSIAPTYTAHVLCGDSVIVLNCGKIKFSGKKIVQKEYDWFTGYTGRRLKPWSRRLARHPDRVLRDAVRRMLPKNKLAFKMLAKLKLYPGSEHPHQAQLPQVKKELAV